jgi:hypothetical protein
MSVTLRHDRTTKNGTASYVIDGVRGSVYITKSMFKDQPPAELNIDGVEFAEPGAGGGGRASDPERVAKAQEKAQKMQERAAKAAERAEKAAARAAKLASKGQATTSEQAEPVEA